MSDIIIAPFYIECTFLKVGDGFHPVCYAFIPHYCFRCGGTGQEYYSTEQDHIDFLLVERKEHTHDSCEVEQEVALSGRRLCTNCDGAGYIPEGGNNTWVGIKEENIDRFPMAQYERYGILAHLKSKP